MSSSDWCALEHGDGACGRAGFTLVEVLIAAGIMVIALSGILSLAFNALSHAKAPANVQQALKFAQERLDYFRAQPNPYMAVGGTYFEPPEGGPRNYAPDYSQPPAGSDVNIIFNKKPALFLREYLYGVDEHGLGKDAGGNDAGRTDAQGRSQLSAAEGAAGSRKYGINEIPPTPTTVHDAATGKDLEVSGIVPNRDDSSDFDGTSAYIDYGFKVTPAIGGPAPTPDYYTFAPRANDDVRPAAGGAPFDPAIKFVREVWIQTNNPNFSTTYCPKKSDNEDTSANSELDKFGGLDQNSDALVPAVIPEIPPYVVAVTVRVFLRDVQTKTFDLNAPAAFDSVRMGADKTAERSSTDGPGYDRRHPLITLVGYYGLRR